MYKKLTYPVLLVALATAAWPAFAQDQQVAAADPEFDELLSLDIDDLSVTTASKRPQKLTDTAAAIYVVTQEDIRRSGSTSIPEALRLVPGVQVAKVASNRWAISARGFNNPLSNKLLVLIDGRTIYTPVFSGVYWDDQSTLIEDVDRIEVIRGPGASLYGANAVDGVINIITKSAEDTQGNLVSLTGSITGGLGEVRHGGKINDNAYYRTYGTYLDAGKTSNPSGTANADNWNRARAGFRIDTKRIEDDTFTLQGDAYTGTQAGQVGVTLPVAPFRTNVRTDNDSLGGNVLARWTRYIEAGSQLSLQAYVDHYTRLEENIDQHVTTADIQLQHTMALNNRNNFIWGGGARLYVTQLDGTFTTDIINPNSNHHILNTFLQDEFAIVPDKLYFTVGTKLEYNDLSGFEVEPSTRLAWHPTPNQTVWGAISRAVRTPSIYEQTVDAAAQVSNVPPVTELHLIGNPNQQSEQLISYELGHRIQPLRNVSFDTALFYNDYNNLQTIGSPLPTFVGLNGNTIQNYPYNNLGNGHTYGGEFAATWNINADWHLAGSYTYTHIDLDTPPTGVAVTLKSSEHLSPLHQFAIQSYYSVNEKVHWDNMIYYVDALNPPVDSYLRYDTRVAWLAAPGLELSLIGRNLLDPHHNEYPTNPQAEISRSFIGQVLWKF